MRVELRRRDNHTYKDTNKLQLGVLYLRELLRSIVSPVRKAPRRAGPTTACEHHLVRGYTIFTIEGSDQRK